MLQGRYWTKDLILTFRTHKACTHSDVSCTVYVNRLTGWVFSYMFEFWRSSWGKPFNYMNKSGTNQEFYNKYSEVILYTWQLLWGKLFLDTLTLKFETVYCLSNVRNEICSGAESHPRRMDVSNVISLALLLQPNSLTFVYPLLAVLLSTWQWWHAMRKFSLSFWTAPHNL